MRNHTAGVLALLALAGCHSEPTTTEQPATVAASDDSGKLWTTAQYADRHTCPSERCGIVGRLSFREAATPLETKGGWVRTTKVYDASCEGGESAYVDKGNKACTVENGITDGKFAEWVRADQLSKTRPADPAEKANENEQLVKDSDDFTQYHATFANLAAKLIADGRCTEGDFAEQGGFVKSTNRRDEPVYFMYCGGMNEASKIYVNAETGTIE